MLDLQFELLGARLNDPSVKVDRKGNFSAHAFLSAPYGIYPTSDGFLSIAMNPVDKLGKILDIPGLISLTEESDWWTQQELIETLLASKLASNTTEFWLTKLDAEDIWCAPLLSLDELLAHDGFRAIDMVQVIERGTTQIKTTRSPIRIDGQKLNSNKAAPRLGEDTTKILSFQKED